MTEVLCELQIIYSVLYKACSKSLSTHIRKQKDGRKEV